MQELREGEEEPVAMSDPRNNRCKREATGLELQEAASSFNADDDRWRPNVERRVASSSFDADDNRRRPDAPPVRRYSISASSLSQHAPASKVRRLKDNVQLARQDCLELRREASELREHSDAELDRVARCLGVLADEAWKQDRAAVEGEARIATLVSEKEKLFSRLWTSEAGIFSDVQPLVQSALDGFNVSTFAYGQSDSGKTHTMSENIMPADKHKIQKEYNAWLRNELAQLAQLEQDRKLQIQRQDSTIQSLQAKIRSLEHPLNDALLSSETKSKCAVDSGLEVQSLPDAVSDRMDSSIVTKKLEEKLKKFDALFQETWWQHVIGGKLSEISEEAKSFSTGNKSLATLFAHTPADVLRHQINFLLVKNFEFLSMTVDDVMRGTSQLEKFSTAIMNGWMAGLGIAMPPKTDALGQLLSDYTKRVYTSQLQDLKDIAATLATEEAEDLAHVAKLRSDLESFVDKSRQLLFHIHFLGLYILI